MQKKSFNSIRFLAIFILICIAATALLSAYFIISNANHDCTGEGCPICAQINDCINLLNNITGLCLIAGLIVAASCLRTLARLRVGHFYTRNNTPVALKVQMNN